MEASEVRKPVLSFGISSILGTHDGEGRRQSLGKQKRKHNQTDLPSAAAVVTSQHNRYSNSSPHSPAIGETCRGLIRSEKADGEDDNSRPQTTDSLRTLSKSASLPLLPQHLPTQAYLYKSLDRYRPKNFEYRRVGHPYSNRTPPKRKKPRTTFSREQIAELEMRFTDQKYLASTERLRLAKDLQLTDAQVKTWFQNRRTKWRRQTAEEREAERNATTKYIIKMQQSAAAVAAGAAFWSPILPLPGSALTSVAGSSV